MRDNRSTLIIIVMRYLLFVVVTMEDDLRQYFLCLGSAYALLVSLFFFFIRITNLCRTTASNELLITQDIFDGGIDTMTVLVINIVSDRVVHTAAVPLPIGICIASIRIVHLGTSCSFSDALKRS